MTNNDILRRLRYNFDYGDDKMMAVFAAADLTVTREQLSNWLKKDDAPDYVEISESAFASFLNGLINTLRGKKDGPQPTPETTLTRNMIFMKLKIALDLKAEDVLAMLALVDFHISNHELSALFRKPGHKHYRECKDQLLRNFLHGMQIHLRGPGVTGPADDDTSVEAESDIPRV